MNVECWVTQPEASPNSPRICSARQNLGSHLDHRVRRRPTPEPPEGSRENRGSHFTNWTEKQQHKHSSGGTENLVHHLVLLESTFFFHVRTVFPGHHRLDIGNRDWGRETEQSHKRIQVLARAAGCFEASYSCHSAAQKELHPEATRQGPRSATLCDSARVCRTKISLTMIKKRQRSMMVDSQCNTTLVN